MKTNTRTCLVRLFSCICLFTVAATTFAQSPPPVSFQAAVNYATGTTPMSVTVGDFKSAPQVQGGSAATASREAATRNQLLRTYGAFPLSFEANQGQTDPRVKFLSRGRGYALFLTGNEAVLSLRKPSAVSGQRSAEVRNSKLEEPSQGPSDTGLWPVGLGSLLPNPQSLIPRQSLAPGIQPPAPAVVRLKLVGASPKAKVVGLAELPGKSNYFLGNDPQKWRTNVANYARVKYEDVYAGIDLVYYGNQQQLEYDFVVAPGADPKAITFEIVGAVREPPTRAHRDAPLQIDPAGDLVIATEAGEVCFHKPVVYQPVAAPLRAAPAGLKPGATAAANPKSQIQNRKSVDGRYILLADNRVGFDIGATTRASPSSSTRC